MLLDQGAQSSFSGVLLPQLLDFFLDQLGIFPDQLGIFLELLRSLFALLDREPIFVHPLLVAGIPSPVEHR